MKKTLQGSQEENEKKNEEKDLAIWDLGSPLYDSFEVVSLTHLIERHLMILPALGSRRLSKKIFPPPPDNVVPATLAVNTAAKGIHDHSSFAKTLNAFVKARLWRKRKNGTAVDVKEDDKPKKTKGGVLRGFSNRFGLRMEKEI